MLARSLAEADRCATQRERAKHTQTALRSGAAGRRKPNDWVALHRAASDPTTSSRCAGRGAHGRVAEAFHSENGRAHKQRRRTEEARVERDAVRHDVIQFLLCALTPEFSCKGFQ
jgi:hypothetical protein